MAKERQYQKRKKRNIKIAVFSIFLLILSGFGFFFFMGSDIQSEDTLEKFNAVGNIPVGDFFALESNILLNPTRMQEFNFVGPTSASAVLYSKMYDSPYIYKHSPGENVYMGARCEEGQLIKFTFCDSANDKSSCTTNMFDNLWQVHKSNNYPVARDFYIDDMEFYWSYSCYKAYTTYADIEKNYLYNGQCVGFDVSLGKGEKFDTQKYCLEALEEQEEAERIAQEKAEALRQEEIRIDNLEKQCEAKGGDFSRSKERCTIPEPKEDTSNTGSTDKSGSTDTTDNTDNTQTDSTDNTNTGGTTTTTKDDSIVSCKAYESVQDNKCKFSFSKVFTTKGFSEYWDEEPFIVVFAGLVMLILVTIFVPKKKGGNKGK